MKRAGPLDAVVAHGDFDGLISAVKFLARRNRALAGVRRGRSGGGRSRPRTQDDERALAGALCDALGEAQSSLRSRGREALRQALVHALAENPDALPHALNEQLDQLRADFQKTLAPALDLAAQAKLENTGVLVLRVDKPLAKPLKKEVLSDLEARAEVGVVIEGNQITAATFRQELRSSRASRSWAAGAERLSLLGHHRRRPRNRRGARQAGAATPATRCSRVVTC